MSEEAERVLRVPVRAIIARAETAEQAAASFATKFNILLDTTRELANLGWFDRLRFSLSGISSITGRQEGSGYELCPGAVVGT